jgi:hypothetical protein
MWTRVKAAVMKLLKLTAAAVTPILSAGQQSLQQQPGALHVYVFVYYYVFQFSSCLQ